ncbi:MAG: hypothetical protein Q9214_005558 [Letrouitia sp. 1 TL-2023]
MAGLGESRLRSDPDHPARRPSARVARRLALLVPALAQVVGAGVDDNGAAEHALRADQLDLAVGDGALGVALRVGLEVPEVADVAVVVGRGAVFFGMGVDWNFFRDI